MAALLGLILWKLLSNVRNEPAGSRIKTFKIFSSRRERVLCNQGVIGNGLDIASSCNIRVQLCISSRCMLAKYWTWQKS
jgi:hypothetical protein